MLFISINIQNNYIVSPRMHSRRETKLLELEIQNDNIQPWNSIRMKKFSGYRKSTPSNNTIFSLSNRKSRQKVKHSRNLSSSAVKPQTAPEFKNKRISMSNELSKLANIAKEDVLSSQFQQDLENVCVHSNFRQSIQPKKQLIFLKPHMKTINKYQVNSNKQSNITEVMEKIKTDIYRNIRTSQYIQDSLRQNRGHKKQDERMDNRSFIEYFTEYEGETTPEQINIKTYRERKSAMERTREEITKKPKNKSISVLRDKLKSFQKTSKYINKMGQIKHGLDIPVTIIQ